MKVYKVCLASFLTLLLSICNLQGADTLQVKWSDKSACKVMNAVAGVYCQMDTLQNCLLLTNLASPDLVISMTGQAEDGRVQLTSESECTLLLDNLILTSSFGPVLTSSSKGKLNIVTSKESKNQIGDTLQWTDNPTIQIAGTLKLAGDGILSIGGKCMDLVCARNLEIEGGIVNAVSVGNCSISVESVTESTIFNIKKNISITGGQVSLTHQGQGGICMLCESLDTKGGLMDLTITGDGGFYGERQPGKLYWDIREWRSYFSSCCIHTKKRCLLKRGTLKCYSSGKGGKGIEANHILQIGLQSDTTASQGPVININTEGDCIYYDQSMDKRDGCPKGIRVRGSGNLYSGEISVNTLCVGGEGIESDTLDIWHSQLICNTYDDGINVKKALTIHGGLTYCLSKNNDGIDSNGWIRIEDGIICSFSEDRHNEPLDADKGELYIMGGVVFGVSGNRVKMQPTSIPVYNTPATVSIGNNKMRTDLKLDKDMYLCLMQDETLIMSILNPVATEQGALVVVSPELQTHNTYTIYKASTAPTSCKTSYFDGNLMLGGKAPKSKDSLVTFVASPCTEQPTLKK